jgi:hypothetical protein
MPPDPDKYKKKQFNPTQFDYQVKRMQIWKEKRICNKRKRLIENTFNKSFDGVLLENPNTPLRNTSAKKYNRVQPKRRFSQRKNHFEKSKSSNKYKKKAKKVLPTAIWEPHSKIGLDCIENMLKKKETLKDRQSDLLYGEFHKNYMAIDLGKMQNNSRLSQYPSIFCKEIFF